MAEGRRRVHGRGEATTLGGAGPWPGGAPDAVACNGATSVLHPPPRPCAMGGPDGRGGRHPDTRSTSASAVSRLVVRANFSAIAASTPPRPSAANQAAGSVADVK